MNIKWMEDNTIKFGKYVEFTDVHYKTIWLNKVACNLFRSGSTKMDNLVIWCADIRSIKKKFWMVQS